MAVGGGGKEGESHFWNCREILPDSNRSIYTPQKKTVCKGGFALQEGLQLGLLTKVMEVA